MKRFAVFIFVTLCAHGGAGADTVLVADFRAERDTLSLGLPYLVARVLNNVSGCQAILPDAPPQDVVARLYDTEGMPEFNEAARLRVEAGADRILLGRAAPSGAPGASTVFFYLAGADGSRPEAFGADIAEDGCIPALAEWAAGKIAPAPARTPPPMPPALLPVVSRGLRLLRAADPERAARALPADAHPRNADVRFLLGRAAALRRKPYAALQLFTEATNLDPSFASPAYREGLLWASLDRPSLAEAAFDRAARIQPSFFEALLESGILKTARGDFAAAEGTLRRALAMRPISAEARYRLADCLARAGRENQARALLADLVEARRDLGPARLLLARLLFQAGDYAAAEAQARAAARLMPNDPDARTLLADALSRQGGYNRHAEAAVQLQRAIWLRERGAGAAP
ncbi:MAG: tetratricopeptide repeat protein [Candidatus Aureabacteria bacterium]|nr:tetratricopeptide repeat protein [Candidatus Auribacterota bacterium]